MIFLNNSWFELKNLTKKRVFYLNYDPKIGSVIFSPNSGIFFYEMAEESPRDLATVLVKLGSETTQSFLNSLIF